MTTDRITEPAIHTPTASDGQIDNPAATDAPTPTDTDTPTAIDAPTPADTGTAAAADTPTQADTDAPTAIGTPTPAASVASTNTSTPTEPITAHRIFAPARKDEDEALETSLRPRRLADYIGQEKVKENLRIAIEAATQRGEPLDHVLLYGPPGLGKTTLANIIAVEMGVSIRITSGPAFERPGDLPAIIMSAQEGDVLFIDEVHRLPRAVEEILYPVMEDLALDMVLGKGPAARTMRLALPPFTIVGATTRYSMLSPPLRDRFGAVYRLDFYTDRDIAQIVARSAKILEVELDDAGRDEIARRSRGTPRVANRLLRRVRDYAQVRAKGKIDAAVARAALEGLGIDELGLDDVDHKVLLTIIDKFGGGPVGLDTIAAAISEEADTIMDVYEPFLLQLGFLHRTPRGRVATKAAYEHLRLPPHGRAPAGQPTLPGV